MRRRARWALLLVMAVLGLQTVLGAPAFAQAGCKSAPYPEFPNEGMVGFIDYAAMNKGEIWPGPVYSPYAEVGYAGLTWYTYDLGCGADALHNPAAVADTWLGNQFFNVSKNIVGAANNMHFFAQDGGVIRKIDDAVSSGALVMYESTYLPYVALALLVAAFLIFFGVFKGDLAAVGKRTAGILGGLWLAAATYMTPLIYTHLLDDLLIQGAGTVRSNILSQADANLSTRNGLPTLRHDTVVYRTWLRGEFGDPDGEAAQRWGRELLAAQSCSKDQSFAKACTKEVLDAKRKRFMEIAEESGAKATISGARSSRAGYGALSMVHAVSLSIFPLFADLGIFLVMAVIRGLVLAGPVLGLLVIVRSEMLLTVARAIGTSVVIGILLVAAASGHGYVTIMVMRSKGIDPVWQLILIILLTVMAWFLVRPLRRLMDLTAAPLSLLGVRRMPWDTARMYRQQRRLLRQQRRSRRHLDQIAAGLGDGTGGTEETTLRYRPEADPNSYTGSSSPRAQTIRTDLPAGSAGPDGAAAGRGLGPGRGGPPEDGSGGGAAAEPPIRSRGETHDDPAGPTAPPPRPKTGTPHDIVVPSEVERPGGGARGEAEEAAERWQRAEEAAARTVRPAEVAVDETTGEQIYGIYRPSTNTFERPDSSPESGTRPETRGD